MGERESTLQGDSSRSPTALPRVDTPRTDGGCYIVNRMDGDIMSPATSRGAFHMYASQVQTENSFSVFGWDGPFTDSQGYHHHLLTHDCFLITEGAMFIYCDGESRMLYPGDFASVPPVRVAVHPCS